MIKRATAPCNCHSASSVVAVDAAYGIDCVDDNILIVDPKQIMLVAGSRIELFPGVCGLWGDALDALAFVFSHNSVIFCKNSAAGNWAVANFYKICCLRKCLLCATSAECVRSWSLACCNIRMIMFRSWLWRILCLWTTGWKRHDVGQEDTSISAQDRDAGSSPASSASTSMSSCRRVPPLHILHRACRRCGCSLATFWPVRSWRALCRNKS